MTTPISFYYRLDIQGIRAIAIILVVLSHSGLFFPGGYIGVDVFFVLSGYLITAILIKEYSQFGSINFGNFISRRMKRLLPSLLVMIIVVMSIAPFIISQYEFLQQTQSSRFATIWTSNLYFAFSTIDYFSDLQTRDLFLHTWSLGVEEQFYLIWPALLVITLSYTSSTHHGHLLIFKFIFILLIISCFSLGISFYWSTTNPLWSFYLMPSRIWQFSIGAITFVWLDRIVTQNSISYSHSTVVTNIIGLSGFLLIIGSAFYLTPDMHYTSYTSIAASLGTVFIIIAGGINNNSIINKILSHKVMVQIGDLSYSIYLWHWPVLILGFAFGIQKNSALEIFLLFIITISLSLISHRYIELPFWKGTLSNSRPSKIMIMSILSILVSVILIQKQTEALEKKVHEIASSSNHILRKISMARMDISIVYSKNCDSWYRSAAVNPCIFGNRSAGHTVVLMGDSIGVQWYSFLPILFPTPDWRIIVLTKSSCPMVDDKVFNSRLGKNLAVCVTWRNAAIHYLSKLAPDLVILGSASNYGFSKQQWVDGSSRLYKKISKFTGNIIVIAGTPKISFNGPNCLMRQYENSVQNINLEKRCGEKSGGALAYKVAEYLKVATDKYSNIALLDLNELVCPKQYCSAQNSAGVIVYRDQQHLTDTFVRKNIHVIKNELNALDLNLF